MNYKHCQFQHFQRCFLVFLFPSRQQRTMQLKGMEKSRLIKKSSIKENLLCMRRQHLLKLMHNRPSQNLSALICFARQEILKSTAHYSILFLNCQKWVTNHSHQILSSHRELQKRCRIQREAAQRLHAAHKTTPPRGHGCFIFAFINSECFEKDLA